MFRIQTIHLDDEQVLASVTAVTEDDRAFEFITDALGEVEFRETGDAAEDGEDPKRVVELVLEQIETLLQAAEEQQGLIAPATEIEEGLRRVYAALHDE